MAKITETQPRDRLFTIEVDTHELQMISRALYDDHTSDGGADVFEYYDENRDLNNDIADFMDDNGIPQLD